VRRSDACESYCLKDGSPQPEDNQAKYHKERMAWFATLLAVAALAEPPSHRIAASWELQRRVKLVQSANSDSVEFPAPDVLFALTQA
jgi:hypothetical protein